MSLILGSGRSDDIDGTDDNDFILTGNGRDTVDGGDGNDIIFTGNGRDVVDGGAGNDIIFSGRGRDLIDGGAGNDYIFAGIGRDTVNGGAGDDALFGGFGNDLLIGDSEAAGEDGPNLIVNGSFEDTTGLTETEFGFVGEIPGWTNNGDTAEVVQSGWVGMPSSEGDYWIDTGTLEDGVIDISQTVAGVEEGETYTLSFDAGQWDVPSDAPDETMNVYWNGELVATIRPEAIDSYEEFEFEVIGGSGDGSNTLRFEGVTDGTNDAQGVVIDNVSLAKQPAEEAGNDLLVGGHGGDTLMGMAGDDTLVGGAGNDRHEGGEGNDVFVFGLCDDKDVITDFEQGADLIKIYGVNRLANGGDAFDELTIKTSGDNTKITVAHTTIILEDTIVTDIDQSDFILA